MLGNMIKLFVGANLLGAGASHALGYGSKDLGLDLFKSFLGGSGSKSSGGTSGMMYLSKVNPEKIKLAGSSVSSVKPTLAGASSPAQFPMGYKSNIANVSPEIRRFLQDAGDGLVGNQNIKLSVYRLPEEKIDVG